MEKCNCYQERKCIRRWLTSQVPVTETVSFCLGTKEREECSCGGDPAKCNFYPEKRATATEPHTKIVDDLGRVAIPKEIRKALEIREGDKVNLTIKNNQIIISKIKESNYA